MAYLGCWEIDDLLTFPANTHTPSTGAATDADSVPSYRVYEDETGTAIQSGSMAKLDDANTTGFYSEQLTLSAANGFEVGKCYTIYISATVGGVVGTMSHTFKVELAPATAAALTIVDDFLDTEIAAIKAKTDNLPSDPADASDIAASFSSIASTLSTISGYIDTEVAAILAAVDTEVAAIKAKTDLIPASPAAVGSAMTLEDGAITAAKIASNAIAAAKLASDAIAKIADAVMRRHMSNVEASSDGDALDLSSLYGLVQQMQEAAISGTTLTAKKTDGSTTLGTKTLTLDGDGHITGIA